MRWLRCVVLIVSCSACAGTALALDPLLVEFGWSQPNAVTLPASYIALVNSHPWNGTSEPNITAYPTTMFADALSVSVWNQDCSSGLFCQVGFSNGGQQPFQSSAQQDLDRILGGPNRLWADGWDGNPQPFLSGFTGTFHATTYVPQKGNGTQALYGYQITTVEREITSTTQTIRLHGVDAPIPEPSTLLLALVAVAPLLTLRRKSVPHNRV